MAQAVTGPADYRAAIIHCVPNSLYEADHVSPFAGIILPSGNPMLMKLFFIALAGGLGALSRYALSGTIQQLVGPAFPLGTAVVNILGCFLFGFIVTLIDERMALPPGMKPYLLTGFMGAFTTFSTYIFETASLIRYSQWLWAAANVLGQTLLGLVFLLAGIVLARAI